LTWRLDNQLVVDDMVVFLLEYELIEIKDGTRSLLPVFVDTGWGMSRLISNVDIWWRVLACIDFVACIGFSSPLRGLVFIPIHDPLSK
jgi:hypothetical protein